MKPLNFFFGNFKKLEQIMKKSTIVEEMSVELKIEYIQFIQNLELIIRQNKVIWRVTGRSYVNSYTSCIYPSRFTSLLQISLISDIYIANNYESFVTNISIFIFKIDIKMPLR